MARNEFYGTSECKFDVFGNELEELSGEFIRH